MKIAKILLFVFIIFAFEIKAQNTNPPKTNSAGNSQQDELLKHLSAAETFQISGDLANAAIENKAIIAIGLQRAGNIAVEEGKYEEAAKYLTESLGYADTAPNRINLAIAYLRQNKLDSAIQEAQKALVLDPNFSYATYILGNIYYTKGDYQSALPYLEKVFRLSPNFEIANALGITYLNLKQLDRAKLLYDEIVIAAQKPNPDLHLLIAQSYEKSNYPAETENEIRRALKINPKHPRANFLLGYFILLHAGSERISEAGLAFEEVLKINSEDFYSNFFVGVVASSNNEHEKAIKFINKAIQLNSTKSEAFLFLAQSQIETGDLVEAEKSLRQAILLEEKEPENSVQSRRTHFLLGRLLVRTGRKEEGEKELKTAAALQKKGLQDSRNEINQILTQFVKEPAKNEKTDVAKVRLAPEKLAELNKFKSYLNEILAQAYHNLGVIAVQTGQTEEALARFEQAARWQPDFPGLDRNWGIVSFRAAQFDKAVAPLMRHLKNNPGDTLVRRMLAASFYFTNNFPKVIETLEPIKTSVNQDAELAYFYGIALIQSKQEQAAEIVFGKLAEVSQREADKLFYAAQGFMMLGSYERAAKEFRQVLALNSSLSKANYFLGQSLIRLNRFDEAEQAFANELAINPADYLSKYHLALTLIERKIETEKTIGILEEAIALKNDYADAHYQLGKIYLEKGQTDKAIEQLETAAGFDTNKDYIYYQLSIAYRKASRKDDADRQLKRYQELKAANRKTDSPMGNSENYPK